MDQNGDRMKTNLIVVDDFYNNPEDVRNFALNQSFDINGNWPGSRTKSFLNESTKEGISKILFNHGGKVIDWNDKDGLTGSFQITTALEKSWIHTDSFNTWAGVCYLTPDAPIEGGTGLFKRKHTNSMSLIKSGAEEEMYGTEAQDLTKWDLVDKVGNIFNRLVLYRSNLWHCSLNYFGSNNNDGRLFQVFFITTEY